MNIENRLGVSSLNEIILYFKNNDFKVDYNKYKFVLTDEEIFVLNEFLESCINNRAFVYDVVADKMFYDYNLTKKRPESTIVARLLAVAYKKIKHVDIHFPNPDMMAEETLLKTMNLPENHESISLEDFSKFANDGVLYSATSRLERFIIKYRIGLFFQYRKLNVSGNDNIEFYQDLGVFCHQLGYADKQLSPHRIDEIILFLNRYLTKIKALVDAHKDLNEIDYSTFLITEMLGIIREHYDKQTDMPDFREYMDTIHEKLVYISELSKPYIHEEKERQL